ncbi:DoxX family protein [Streptomyces sp. AJS327]|uniref:DoxX family protein n=1 Tax=Streptomyces sp. AJS327 TaxID=2545265 RepID=UPI0015DFC6F1|nr:DoxX family protein [Streptomyces sp. AJS327]MBA0050580.1 DoxX family protein [Streptomyces sp. AJS327]
MPTPYRTLDTPTTRTSDRLDAPVPVPSPGQDWGLLILRVVLGLTIAAHGTQKLFGWFDGDGLAAAGQSFEAMGYPSGEAMALLAGLSEALGGLGLVLGLLTPLAGAAVVGTMINAIAVTHEGGFFSPGGYEFALLIGAGAATLALTGPGSYALDRSLPVLRAHRPSYGVAALGLGGALALLVLLIRG